jgi:hypothetical protein
MSWMQTTGLMQPSASIWTIYLGSDWTGTPESRLPRPDRMLRESADGGDRWIRGEQCGVFCDCRMVEIPAFSCSEALSYISLYPERCLSRGIILLRNCRLMWSTRKSPPNDTNRHIHSVENHLAPQALLFRQLFVPSLISFLVAPSLICQQHNPCPSGTQDDNTAKRTAIAKSSHAARCCIGPHLPYPLKTRPNGLPVHCL